VSVCLSVCVFVCLCVWVYVCVWVCVCVCVSECVWSRNVNNEAAYVPIGLLRHKKTSVVWVKAIIVQIVSVCVFFCILLLDSYSLSPSILLGVLLVYTIRQVCPYEWATKFYTHIKQNLKLKSFHWKFVVEKMVLDQVLSPNEVASSPPPRRGGEEATSFLSPHQCSISIYASLDTESVIKWTTNRKKMFLYS